MEIVTKEKVDWYETLLKAEIGKIIPVDYEERHRVRTVISNDLKKSHPKMQFFTKVLTKDDSEGNTIKYLMVIRLK